MSVSIKEIKSKAAEYYDWMVRVRRHIHRNPEISFREHDTTRYIIDELTSIGIPVERPLDTGCVGILEGKNSDNGPVIALRADIDALSMNEEGEQKKDFLSERPGAAHCCGHDAHTANLLGAARIVADFKDHLSGKVLFIFQPGEEKLPGGGRLLSESGYLQSRGVDAIYGLHMYPQLKPGTIAIKSGPLMARPDEFEIELIGKAGHAASPHLTVDPVVMAAEAIIRFQTVVSRSVDPTEPAVVTVGKVESGSTYNVIPEKAYLMGTVRSFNRQTAMLMRDRLEQITKSVAEGAGGSYNFVFNEGYPAVNNDEKLTSGVIEIAKKLIGENAVIELEKPIMAGEDFAFYQEHFPGVFFFLGSGSEEAGSTWNWHHPKYNIDESCFLTGAPLMAALAFRLNLSDIIKQ
jgi:amidohydrolase